MAIKIGKVLVTNLVTNSRNLLIRCIEHPTGLTDTNAIDKFDNRLTLKLYPNKFSSLLFLTLTLRPSYYANCAG